MTPSDPGTINVGQAVRDGLRLKTVDVVALLYDVCLQLEIDRAKKLPTSVDELSINETGSVVMPSGRPEPTLRTAVATLLDALLSTASDEAEAVPPALRSLPDRLRAAGNAAKASDIKDLLTILRWHLPSEPRLVLRDLAVRARLGATPDTAPPIARPLVEKAPLIIKAAPEKSYDPPLILNEAPAIEERQPIVAEAPAAIFAPPIARRRRPLALTIAFAMLALIASAYLGYRVAVKSFDPAIGSSEAAVRSSEPVRSSEAAVPSSEPAVEAGAPSPSVSATEAPAPTAAAPRIVNRATQTPLAEPRPLSLSVNGGAFSPSFAAGTRTLLFHAGRNTSGRLFSATLDDDRQPSAVTPLLDDRGRTYHVRLSPDGRRLAFDSDRDGERGVYVAERDGSNIERISGSGYAAVPTWSPDMKTLAFVRAEPGRPRVWNLWQRDLTDGEVTRLTNFKSGQVWGASWFADASRYVFSHDDRLIVADRTGRQLASFRSPIAGRLVRTPAVSPDGTRIVFQVFRDGAWVVDIATGKMRRVLDDPSAEEFAWDPDGRHVAYHSRRDGQWRIWLMPI